MTHEEPLVLSFLWERPESAFSRGEVARRAKRKVFEAEPDWVDVPSASLVARRQIEVDWNGDYPWAKGGLFELRRLASGASAAKLTGLTRSSDREA